MGFTLNLKNFVVAVISSACLTSAIPAEAGTLAAPFAINIGDTSADVVAWVSGGSKCNNVILGPLNTNPCSRPFNLNGQNGFTLEGCGGSSLWINQNGQLFAECSAFSEGDQCGVVTVYHCA